MKDVEPFRTIRNVVKEVEYATTLMQTKDVLLSNFII